MASLSHSTLAFGSASASASDYLRSSSNGVSGVSLKTLGRAAFTTRRRDMAVTARLKKGKKFDHPWPANPDPNVKGGILSYLSDFKPLGDTQKPVTLDFERPLVELEKKILDVRKMATETGLDFTEQIVTLENKYRQALKDLYTHLTPMQRVNIARHPNRPTFLDHIYNITDKFMELHGDRAGYDDPAIVTGIGTIDGKRYMFIGHQKGRNTKENIMRNFGMPTPHGYRKALRMMYYADHHGFPIVTFIDTPGAYADLKSEELGQGEAIANNLRTMFGLKVPILSIVIGEGGSGGALAIGCCNKMLMLENAVFYVASPEACAAILWQTSEAAPEAAEKLRITSKELLNLEVADGIIPEPLGGAHADPAWTSQQIKIAINENMNEFEKMSGEELLKHRAAKYRKMGVFIEGVPVDAESKANMKKSDVVATSQKLDDEVEKLREQILKAKETSSEDEPSSEVLDEVIEKLKSEIDDEYTEAARAVGLEERLTAMREEFSKANAEEHLMHPVLIEKIEKLKEEFNARLSDAPNYESLKSKLSMLRDFSRAKASSEAASLRKEIDRRFQEAVDRPEIREKIESVKAEVAKSGASSFEELSDELKEKVLKTKGEVEAEMAGVLNSMGLELEAVELKSKLSMLRDFSRSKVSSEAASLRKEIDRRFQEAVDRPEIREKIESVKAEVAKSGASSFEELSDELKEKVLKTKGEVEAEMAGVLNSLRKEIDRRFQETADRPEIREKIESVKAEVAKSGASSFEELSDELKEKVLKTKGEVEAEMAGVLNSMGLELEAVEPNLEDVVEQNFVPDKTLQEKIEKLNQEITEKIEEVVESPEIKTMVELLKVESAKVSEEPGDKEASQKIETLEQQIKQKISEALSTSGLEEKQEEIEKEIAAALEVAAQESEESEKEDGEDNGSVKKGVDDNDDGSRFGTSETSFASIAKQDINCKSKTLSFESLDRPTKC